MVVTLAFGAAVAEARQAAAAAPPAAQADQFMFTSDAGQVIFQVKPASSADFESAWGDIKTKLSASDKPDWKALGDSISLWKVATPGAADAPVIFVLQINPASKTLSYDPGKILFATGGLWERARSQATSTKKIVDSLAAGFNVCRSPK